MLNFQGVLFLPYSRNRRNSKWTSSRFSIENVLKVDFLLPMSICLRVTEENSTKMGILRFSILILFTSFPTFSISTGVQILGFLILGVGVLIRIAVSLLPGVSSLEGEFPPTTGKFPCKPSNRPSMLAMAWVDMLESDLFGRCSIFFGWVSQMLRSEVLEIHCRYAK